MKDGKGRRRGRYGKIHGYWGRAAAPVMDIAAISSRVYTCCCAARICPVLQSFMIWPWRLLRQSLSLSGEILRGIGKGVGGELHLSPWCPRQVLLHADTKDYFMPRPKTVSCLHQRLLGVCTKFRFMETPTKVGTGLEQ